MTVEATANPDWGGARSGRDALTQRPAWQFSAASSRGVGFAGSRRRPLHRRDKQAAL